MEKLIKSKILFLVIIMEFLCVSTYYTVELLERRKDLINLLIIGLLLYVACVVVLVKRKHRKAPGWWCFYKASGWIMTGYLGVFAIGFMIYGINYAVDMHMEKSGKKYYTAAEADAIVVEEKGQSILEHSDLLLDLKPDVYRNLDTQEKVNVLNRVVQIEAEYLGIEPPMLQVVPLEDNVVGTHVRELNIVLISDKYVNYEETTLFALLHEMYHAYQHACAELPTTDSELLFFRQVEQWRKELADVKVGTGTKEDHLSYYMQDIEISARKYAEERLAEYGKIIVIGNTP